jgi:hypothetical protein
MLGLDPGPTHSAIVLYQHRKVIEHTYGENALIRELVRQYGLMANTATYDGHRTLTIEEMSSYGAPVGRETFRACSWAGRYAELWYATTGREALWLPRLDVKMALCGVARAKDRDVREELIHRLGPPGSKKAPGPTYGLSGDQWAALAVAVAATQIAEAGR